MRSDVFNVNSGDYGKLMSKNGSGDDVHAMVGTKKWSSFVGSLADTNADSVTYGDNDIVVQLGAFDTSLPDGYATATKILVEKIVVVVSTASGATHVGNISAGTTAGELTNAAATGQVELFGAGATQLDPEGYAKATTATEADDLNYNSAGIYWCAPNIVLPVATNQIYACTTTAVSADVTAGRFTCHIEYTVA